MKRVLLLISCIVTLSALWSESVRGTYKGSLLLSQEGQQSIETGVETLFSIAVEGEKAFLKGFELELRVPESLAAMRGSFALFIYDGVAPSPSETVRSYRGRELGYTILTDSRRQFIRYAFDNYDLASKDPDIQLFSAKISTERLPLICSVLPVMKGIPNSIYAEKITVIIHPILKETGILSLAADNEFPVTLYIDDKEIPRPWTQIDLSPGLHQLRMESDHYETYTRQIGINKGVITEVTAELIKKVPRILIEAPNTAEVYIDGEKITDPAKIREIAPGEHSIIISIGDYSLTKSLRVEEGQTYNIQLFMDIMIKVD